MKQEKTDYLNEARLALHRISSLKTKIKRLSKGYQLAKDAVHKGQIAYLCTDAKFDLIKARRYYTNICAKAVSDQELIEFLDSQNIQLIP